MRSSANDPSLDEKTVLLSEEVKPRTATGYAVLLFFISLAFWSVFWMVPVPRPIFRIILVALGSVMLLFMLVAVVRRTMVSFLYVLTDEELLVFRVLFGKKKQFISLKLSEIIRMDRLTAGLPEGKRKNACVTRLPACDRGFYILTAAYVLLIEPSENFARTLSRTAVK